MKMDRKEIWAKFNKPKQEEKKQVDVKDIGYHVAFTEYEELGKEFGWCTIIVYKELEHIIKPNEIFSLHYQGKHFADMTFNSYGKKGLEYEKETNGEEAIKYIKEENKTILYFSFDLEGIKYATDEPKRLSKYCSLTQSMEIIRIPDMEIKNIKDGYVIEPDNIYRISF